MMLRYDEYNCAPQCHDCNSYKNGRPSIHEEWIKAHHGPEKVEELNRMAQQIMKLYEPDIQVLIDHYKEKIKYLPLDHARIGLDNLLGA